MSDASFAMLCCAHGAETAVKQSMGESGWRLAFSRPGFVTAKRDRAQSLPSGVFIRTAAWSIGQVQGNRSDESIRRLREQLDASPQIGGRLDQLHVWPKDRAAVGRFDFEPGVDEVSRAVAEELFPALQPRWIRSDAFNRIAQPGETVLDVVLVSPSHWFVGWHTAHSWPTRWPGGIQPIQPARDPVSRAYYKAAEAIPWSGFDMQPGDIAVEIGSAPGGASGRLLELGLRVIGIDPAEMDPRIAEHPRFRHLRARAGDLPRKEFRDARWMLVDSNVKPEQTLITVGNIVTHRQTSFQGLLITLKLGDYRRAHQIDDWRARIESWGAKQIQVRQLARNRCEVCFAVTLEPR